MDLHSLRSEASYCRLKAERVDREKSVWLLALAEQLSAQADFLERTGHYIDLPEPPAPKPNDSTLS